MKSILDGEKNNGKVILAQSPPHWHPYLIVSNHIPQSIQKLKFETFSTHKSISTSKSTFNFNRK
jgi:hypothetical protein